MMAAAFGYAAIIFVGLKAGWEDVARGVQAQARPFFLWHDRRTPSETRNHGS
jgi:hypothetical protein